MIWLFYLVVFTIVVDFSGAEFEFKKPSKCPEYATIPNFDFKSLNGDWYEVFQSKIDGEPSFNCSKSTITISDNNNVQIDSSLFIINEKSEFKITNKFTIDDSKYLISHAEIQDDTLLGPRARNATLKSAIIYSNDNLIILYGCFETMYLDLYPTAHISYVLYSRDRIFDSFNKAKLAVMPLLELGGRLNDFVFISNGPTCTN